MLKIISFFIITLFDRLYVRVGILLICGKHVHDRIISLRGGVWVHKANLIPPLFIEVPVPSKENERFCACVFPVSVFPLSTILIFDLGSLSTMWYFLVFIL